MKRRRMTAEDRKRAIVGAALPLFARQGYAETTTKDLALAAGVSQPLLYKHFPSKEALYREILKFSRQDDDPAVQKLAGLKPSASTLVYLVYYFMRALVLGKPVGVIEWETRHRLDAQEPAGRRRLRADGLSEPVRLLLLAHGSVPGCGHRRGGRGQKPAHAGQSRALRLPCGSLDGAGASAAQTGHQLPGFPRKAAGPVLSGLSCAAWG